MKEVKPVRDSLIKNPVIITGLNRSGKWMLSTIVSSFRRAEQVSVNYLMEEIVMMYSLGLVRDDAVRSLLRYAVDFMGYNMFIGRNINVRPGDYTSIWAPGKSYLFLNRLFSKEGENVLKRIREENPIFVLLLHNALWYFDIYKDAFSQMKMIHIDRHPVDIAYSWYSKGCGADFTDNFYNGTVTVKAGNEQLLYYVAGKEEEYSKMSEADRVVCMIKDIKYKHDQKYQSLSADERKNVKIVFFERMVTDPAPVLEELTMFLATKKTKHTLKVCKKQKCPRKLYKEERERKIIKFKEICSKEVFQLLMDMAKDYESRYGLK